jgi:hypothetical protein
MSGRRLLAWSLGAACALLPARAMAQGAGDALAQARAQLRERNLDSAAALLRRITDSTTWVDTARRLNALVLAGIVRYYMGENVMSAESFRAALEIDPALVVPRLADMDSTLGALFDSARVEFARAPSRDTLYSCSPQCEGLEVEPRLLDPGLPSRNVRVFAEVGDDARHGTALLRAIVDTLGHVEPGSVEVVTSSVPQEILQAVVQNLLDAHYRPGRAHGRPVRVLIERRVHMMPRPQH